MEPQAKTKQVNGVVLEWSEEAKMYAYPMPEGAQMQLFLDEDKGTLIPVELPGNMVWRERLATAPDGSTLRERTLFQNPNWITPESLEQKRLQIEDKKEQFFLQFWETLVNARPLFVLGVALSLAAFFYFLIGAMSAFAGMIAQAASVALASVLTVAIYAAGGLMAVVALRYLGPLLLRPSKAVDLSAPSVENSRMEPKPNSGGNIVVNIQKNDGGAQNLINNRDF